MFRSQTRKLKILFGFADAVLTAAAFTLAYDVREYSPLTHQFFLTPDVHTLLLGFCLLTWVGFGYWLDVYGKLESVRIRVILADSIRQVGSGALALVVLVYVAKLDISRFFLGLFVACELGLPDLVPRSRTRNFVSRVSRENGGRAQHLYRGTGRGGR